MDQSALGHVLPFQVSKFVFSFFNAAQEQFVPPVQLQKLDLSKKFMHLMAFVPALLFNLLVQSIIVIVYLLHLALKQNDCGIATNNKDRDPTESCNEEP